MAGREEIVEIFSDLRNFADNDVHPVVSSKNWNVYSKLRDLIDRAEEDALALLKEQEAREQCLKTKCVICPHCDHCDVDENGQLKEQEGLLGIQQTADGITFISTGTAQQGEERGILLGKLLMHEWIYKELLHKELLTDDIRSVLEQAKRI